MYFDPKSGEATIQLTASSRIDVVAMRRHLAGPDYKGLRVETVEYSRSRLVAASITLSDAGANGKLGVQIVSASIDTRANQLSIDVGEGDLEAARSIPFDVVVGGIPVAVVVASPVGDDGACTSRTSCTDPGKSGTRISSGGKNCTMGVHINHGGDYHYLTSGHCGWGGYSTWSHSVHSGTVTQSWYQNNGFDAMACQLPRRAAFRPDLWRLAGGHL
jgi:hypothetical protein